MKKFSLVMVLAILLSAFMPVMAADENNVTIALSSISEGDTYVCGNNVVLSAETNAADVKNIDFYANGEKLPGTLTDSNGTLIWYAPSAGDYAVTAKANFISGTSEESTPVNISVKEDIKVISQMNTADDAKLYKKGWSNVDIADEDISTDYKKFGDYSLHIVNMSPWDGANPEIALKGDNIGSTDEFEYFNLLLYNASEVDAYYRVSIIFKNMTDFININPVQFAKGWNKITKQIPSKYENKEIDKIIIASYGYGLDAEDKNENIDLTKVDYYINGMWLSNSNEAITATPSIPNGQTDVCNNLSKYTVTYNKAVLNPSIALYNGETEITDGIEAEYGNDYARLVINEGVLEYDTEYTVKVGQVEDIFGNTLAASEYKFKTIETNCDNVTPIPTLTYPSNGASVATNAALAAKVIFTGNVSKVEFVETDKVLGEAELYTGNEYQLNATLETGKHTVSAKVTTNDGTTITTDPVTFTVGTAVSHCITGIADNTRFIVGSSVPKTIAVTDENKKGTTTSVTNATDVAKAEFYIDDVKTYTSSDAPYTYELPTALADVGTHSLKVKVYDIYGGIKDYGPYSYSVLLAKVGASYVNDFESNELTMQCGNLGENEPEISNGMLKIGPMADGYNGTGLFAMGKINLSDTKYVVTEFDVCRNSKYLGVRLQFRDSFWNATYVSNAFELSSGDKGDAVFEKDTTYHVTVVTDFDKLKYVTYVNGVEYSGGNINNNINGTVLPHFGVIGGDSTAVVYLDNYSVKSYEEVSMSDIKEYALLGVEDGDRFIANDGYSRTVAVIDADKKGVNNKNGESGSTELTNATNVEKVVFKIDGEKAAEVTTSPYSFKMPFDKIGTHTLTADVTDIFGITHTYSANYTVVYGTVKTREVHDYDDGVIPKSGNYELKDGATIQVSDNVLEIVTPKGSYTNQIGIMDTWSNMGTSDIVCTEFDVKRTGSGTQVNILLADAYYSYRDTILTMPQNNNKVFKTNQTYHVSIIADYSKMAYTISVDGVEFVRGEMVQVTKKQAYIQLMISSWDGSSTYIDNFEFTAYDTLTNGVAADVTIDNVFENVKGTVNVSAAVANAGTSDVTVNTIYAVYDTTGKKLVSVIADPVTLKENEISFKSHEVDAGDGAVVKVFTWDKATSAPITRK